MQPTMSVASFYGSPSQRTPRKRLRRDTRPPVHVDLCLSSGDDSAPDGASPGSVETLSVSSQHSDECCCWCRGLGYGGWKLAPGDYVNRKLRLLRETTLFAQWIRADFDVDAQICMPTAKLADGS